MMGYVGCVFVFVGKVVGFVLFGFDVGGVGYYLYVV